MSPDVRSMPSAITARRGCISFATPPTLPLKALFPNCSPVNHLLPPAPAADPPYLRGLNDPQRQAVLTTEGPVLMLAGAGTGTTAALPARLAHLIASKTACPAGHPPVTFNPKPAGA